MLYLQCKNVCVTKEFYLKTSVTFTAIALIICGLSVNPIFKLLFKLYVKSINRELSVLAVLVSVSAVPISGLAILGAVLAVLDMPNDCLMFVSVVFLQEKAINCRKKLKMREDLPRYPNLLKCQCTKGI